MIRRVRILHGDIGSGKTTRARDWATEQALAGRLVGGVLARKTGEGRRFGDLMTGDEVSLEHPADGEKALAVGRFLFRRAAFDWAIARVEAAVSAGAQAVIIDEVGPLEVRGDGFAPLLDRLAHDYPVVTQVLLVRSSLTQTVVERFAAGADVEFDPGL
jgi:nucleoside-triphosphatase THEP1